MNSSTPARVLASRVERSTGREGGREEREEEEEEEDDAVAAPSAAAAAVDAEAETPVPLPLLLPAGPRPAKSSAAPKYSDLAASSARCALMKRLP